MTLAIKCPFSATALHDLDDKETWTYVWAY